jgi:uncharacterized protein YecE (DUF72 family)
MAEILIGTSGYDYPEWKGVFYPDDLKRKDFLSYYAGVFNALELNNTFYNMPTADRLMSFYERSDGRLKFSIKANRMLTHEIRGEWKTDSKTFIDAVSPLAQKDSLCSILFQFPQSFHYTKENRIYLSDLINEFKGFPVVIEFRHVEWIRESVLEGLESRGVSLCYCDMPELKYLPNNALKSIEVVEPVETTLKNASCTVVSTNSTTLGTSSTTPSIFYLRLHGRNGENWYSNNTSAPRTPHVLDSSPSARYTYNYTDAELSEFTPIITQAVITGKKPIVFFNNHPNGSGARNAVKLKEMLLKGN